MGGERAYRYIMYIYVCKGVAAEWKRRHSVWV